MIKFAEKVSKFLKLSVVVRFWNIRKANEKFSCQIEAISVLLVKNVGFLTFGQNFDILTGNSLIFEAVNYECYSPYIAANFRVHFHVFRCILTSSNAEHFSFCK